MKKIVALCSVMLALSASAVLAAGLDLTWKDCVLETTQQDINFTNCTNSGLATTTIRLYSVLKTPVPLPAFIAVQCVYDLQQSGVANVDPYWRFDAVCNANGMSIANDPDPAGQGICAGEINPWGNAGAEASSFIVLTTPSGPRNRIITATGRDAAAPFPLNIIDNYYINTLSFNTLNRATCPGCNAQVWIVWNDAELAENTGNRVHVTGPDKLGNCAQFNHAPPSNCIVTAVKKTTWGQLKSIYR